MDGLSAAASGLAVVSVAIQLAEVYMRLYDFWESVRDAPKEVALITHDLKLLSAILEEMDRCGSNSPTVTMGLDACLVKVQRLTAIVDELERDFHSTSRRDRLWGALKASTKTKQLEHFRDSLNDTKFTLMLGIMSQRIHSPKRRLLSQMTRLNTTIPADDSPPPYSPSIEDPLSPISPQATSLGEWKPSREIAPAEGTTSRASAKPNRRIKKLFQQSMQTAVDEFLASGALEELLADSIGQVTQFETQSCGSFTPDDYQIQGPALTTGGPLFDPSKNFTDLSRASRICHRTSSVGVLFGKIWRRTSTLRLATKSGSAAAATSGEFEITTSFIFYPCSVLTMTGLGRGVEASLKNSRAGWKFALNPIRAVPDNSLIFELCTAGDWTGVQRLLQRQDASLKDTNSRGWTPLHFAAEAGQVDLCDKLLQQGADKRALAFEGPTKDALSPITIFVATNYDLPAEHKIRMLRLFSDCLELTDPSGDGWTVHAELKRAYNREKVPIPENSISWLLRTTASEEFIVFGPKTIWTALQSSVRSFLVHERNRDMLHRLLGFSDDDQKKRATSDRHTTSIAHWLALRASQRELLPMILEAGRLCNMAGFDWVQDELTPSQFVRTLPVIYHAWALAFPNNVEQVESHIGLELEAILERGGLDALFASAPPGDKAERDELECSMCATDYSSSAGIGVVSPARIAFLECVKTHHAHRCGCSAYLQASSSGFLISKDSKEEAHSSTTRRPAEYISPFQDEDEEASGDGGGGGDAPPDISPLCEEYLASQTDLGDKSYDPFTEAATILYRAQGRTWLGGPYNTDERLCATCFLLREKYIDENGLGTEGQFPEMPESYAMCRAGEGEYCFDKE